MTRSIQNGGKMKISELEITEQSVNEFIDEMEARCQMKLEDYNYLIASLQAELIDLNSKIIRLQDALVDNKQITATQQSLLAEEQLPAMKDYAHALTLRIEDLKQHWDILA